MSNDGVPHGDRRRTGQFFFGNAFTTAADCLRLIGALGSAVLWLLQSRAAARAEQRSVTRGFLSEVHRLLKVLARHRSFWAKAIDEGHTDVPLIPFATDFYDRMQTRVPALDDKVLQDVVQFYGYLKYINEFQVRRREHQDLGKEEAFDTTYLELLTSIPDDGRTARFERYFAEYVITSGE